MSDDEAQYWAQMQAEAAAAEAEAAYAAQAEYETEMERQRHVAPLTIGGNVAPLTVGEGVVPLTVGEMSNEAEKFKPIMFRGQQIGVAAMDKDGTLIIGERMKQDDEAQKHSLITARDSYALVYRHAGDAHLECACAKEYIIELEKRLIELDPEFVGLSNRVRKHG